MLQIIVSDWNFPGYLKFLGVTAVTFGLLLLIYEYAVRYTHIGALLNRRKTRRSAIPEA